jgi:hypothetical protein
MYYHVVASAAGEEKEQEGGNSENVDASFRGIRGGGGNRDRQESTDSNYNSPLGRDRFESLNSIGNVQLGWSSGSPMSGVKGNRDRSFTSVFRSGIHSRIGLNSIATGLATPGEEEREGSDKISNGDSVDRLVHNIYSIATWAATAGDPDNSAFDDRLACRCHALLILRNRIHKEIATNLSRQEVSIHPCI